MSAQRGADHTNGGGPYKGLKQNDNCSQAQLYSMPPQLCDDIALAAERAAENMAEDIA